MQLCRLANRICQVLPKSLRKHRTEPEPPKIYNYDKECCKVATTTTTTTQQIWPKLMTIDLARKIWYVLYAMLSEHKYIYIRFIRPKMLVIICNNNVTLYSLYTWGKLYGGKWVVWLCALWHRLTKDVWESVCACARELARSLSALSRSS